jgi:hypothetical protein
MTDPELLAELERAIRMERGCYINPNNVVQLLALLRREQRGRELLKESARAMRVSEYAGERMLAELIDTHLKESQQ